MSFAEGGCPRTQGVLLFLYRHLLFVVEENRLSPMGSTCVSL